MAPLRPSPSQAVANELAPGLAFARVLSSADIPPADSVQWTYRDLRQGSTLRAPESSLLREVAVPAEWTSEAALAFLLGRIPRDAAWLSDAPSINLPGMLVQIGTHLRDHGLAAGYFARADDASLFADEIVALLLTQKAALGAGSDSPHGDLAASAPRRVTLETPGLAQMLAQLGTQAPDAPEIEIAIAPETIFIAAENAGGILTGRAQENLRLVIQSILATGQPTVELSAAGASQRTASRRQHDEETRNVPSATLNLARFLQPDGCFDVPLFSHAVRLLTTALEIETSAREQAGQPQPATRPIALHLTNFGALLMESGIPYDTPSGRTLAAAVVALLQAEALAQSARIAETCPPLLSPREGNRAMDSASHPGACAAFRHDPAAALQAIRTQRAAAFRLEATPAEEDAAPIAALARDRMIDSAAGSTSGSLSISRDAPLRVKDAATAPVSDTLAQQLPSLLVDTRASWDRALMDAELFGLRHLSLTGGNYDAATAATVLDCDSVGMEPLHSLVGPSRQTAIGQPAPWHARRAVSAALFRLGYSDNEARSILATLERTASLAHAAPLRQEHRCIFAIASDPASSKDASAARIGPPSQMHPESHSFAMPESAVDTVDPSAVLQLHAAMQPFIPASAPCTISLPPQATPTEILRLLVTGAQAGIKRLQFRKTLHLMPLQERLTGANVEDIDARGSRSSASTISPAPPADPSSPLRRDHAAFLSMQLTRPSKPNDEKSGRHVAPAVPPPRPQGSRTERNPLPVERASVTHSVRIGGSEGSITVGLYPDGSPGEILLRMIATDHAGNATHGLLDAFSTAVSLALQHGVPVSSLADSLRPMHFEPSGATSNPEIPYARSLVDYLFRWLALRFPTNAATDDH